MKRQRPHRVIVIGAGMSGLSCARELQHRGYHVLVVEARQRVGGRLKGTALQLPTGEQQVDLGGALIHGIDDNPVAELVDQIGVRTRPVSDTLLLDKTGWPLDWREDERISHLFNECLEEAFERTRGKQSDTSFGDLFNTVCEGKAVNTSAILRWHKANLEVSCGTSFEKLGWQWNEDEAYGFDGDHVALQASWKPVVEALAEPLDIVYNASVELIHLVHPNPISKAVTTTKDSRQPTRLPMPRTASSQCINESLPSTPTRHSRRVRGQDADSRRSPRVLKGQGVDRFTVDHATADLKKRVRTDSGETGPRNTVVQITLMDGTVLEADSVVCTVPLGILKRKTISFDPPLPTPKQQAIERLGIGLLNKCTLSFPHVFWQDSDFLGLAEDEHSYLVLNGATFTDNPVLLFMFGGEFAHEIEKWTDTEIVTDCLRILSRICGCQVPEPTDYHTTRWGREQYSRMAFTFIPPGVDGAAELRAMGEPVLNSIGNVPALMFAGEHTTFFHPSTIHGAFFSGIREAYRLDIALEPEANNNFIFSEEELYLRTFPIERKFNASQQQISSVIQNGRTERVSKARSHRRRGAAEVMKLRQRPRNPSNRRSHAVGRRSLAASPQRRSHRSVVAHKSPLGIPNNGKGDEAVDGKYHWRLESMEDRSLIRAVESYGRDFDYVRESTLPIFGSSFRKTAKQVRDRCRQLFWGKRREKEFPSSAISWRSWTAKTVYPLTLVRKPKGSKERRCLVGTKIIDAGTEPKSRILEKTRFGRTVKQPDYTLM